MVSAGVEGRKKYLYYYTFRDGTPDKPPTNWLSKFDGNAWEYVPHLGKWYLHLFDVTQADLNWENPEVREELKDILRFWKLHRRAACCIRYFNPAEHELTMTFSFHHLKVDYKGGDKWSLMPADISALKKLFETWQIGMSTG